MAIDFSQVKAVTIPEGSVKKITDSNGNILWKTQTAGWHTVWEGNQKIGYGGQAGKKLFATEPYSDTLKIRVSFSSLYADPSNSEYLIYIPSNKVSPVTYDSFNSNSTTLVKAYTYNASSGGAYNSFLVYNKSSGEIFGNSTSEGSGGRAQTYIVITKIEVYK